MPIWNADQYLRYGNERTQPCRDLAARVEVPSPRRVIDLGCGPGNSTEVLAARWPDAELTGLDSSREMIDAARGTSAHHASRASRTWAVGDIAAWASGDDGPYDVVFSNAALHWLDGHGAAFPRLLAHVGPGGALAVQMPNNGDGAAHQRMRELATSDGWRGAFPAGGVRQWHVHEPAFYYDALAPHVARIDLWETEYIHVMAGPEAIVDWYKGTGLQPFLQALPSEADRARFVAEYLERVRGDFPRQPDGRVLFPFRRLFIVAYRPALAAKQGDNASTVP